MDSSTGAHVNTQLIATIDVIISKLRTGKDQVDINLLDFAKAFAKVSHVRLPYKLNYYGIRSGTSTPGSKNSRVKGQTSTQNEVPSGVPQGTVLGPLLFLVFINDLPDVIKTSVASVFADDCLLYRHIRNEKYSADLQTNLSALEDWETKWQMRFHPEKCRVTRVCTNMRLRRNT